MLDIVGLKGVITGAILAFALGAGVGGVSAHRITSKTLNAEHTAAIEKMRREIAEANNVELEKGLAVERAQAKANEELRGKTDAAVKQRDTERRALQDLRERVGPFISAGGVFVDPGRKASGPVCRDDSGGTSETAGADTAHPGGELSPGATQFLFAYGTKVEQTRQDLKAMKAYADAVYEQNVKLREVLKQYQNPSSHQ
ncbi:hypothetical protein FDI24_gp130 [Acidovorax phage ACP17]|uniref:Lysis protein n=1 Tax=Acidovorax phage ACP17 TaxID=2010329 RepID=A0A218M2Z0_9CAUD|nr:hypothetical protein FDI24_gp130 [Acidovorax phage ACP17]ASD50411.1 hypothetical protein [Acidovorax phage ACP17]